MKFFSTDATSREGTLAIIRQFLLVILLIGIVGTVTELLLLEHFEDPPQWIPLALLVVGLVATLFRLFRPGRRSLRIFQGLMVLFIIAGAIGVLLHLRGNLEFEKEMSPELEGFDLFWKVITGATPMLAPGTMVQFGLIGLAYGYKHPDLTAPTTGERPRAR
jgi:hypothetical protein